jgi:Surfeit locus protein 6/60S ribosome biogenesis protein Rrp14
VYVDRLVETHPPLCLLNSQDQWKRKKQTKEEAAAARRAKLDPDSIKSAKDVMDEQSKKRKLYDLDESDIEGVEKEVPKQGLKAAGSANKKQKTDKKAQSLSTTASADKDDTAVKDKAEQKKLKLQRKKEKLAKKLERKKTKKEKIAEKEADLAGDENEVKVKDLQDADGEGAEVVANGETAEVLEKIDLEGITNGAGSPKSTASPSPDAPSPTFDNPAEPSTDTSTSSIIPPATVTKHVKLPKDMEVLKVRLAERLELLRAARKANGPNGAPARNRQELMEARRKKEEQRRAHKKELRLKAKMEEEVRREEALASARDSPMSPAIHNSNENFSFNRVSFADGQTLAADLSSLRSAPKRKGPQDALTALQASEKKRLRLAGLDDDKRADIEEKDLWLNANKRAHGEKVRDDTSLLKKTLKRKEKQKKKSEKEWNGRKEGVAKGIAARQKKREDNLRKRKEEKGSSKGKGKSGGKIASKGAKKKVKSRPGFEGSFVSRKAR